MKIQKIAEQMYESGTKMKAAAMILLALSIWEILVLVRKKRKKKKNHAKKILLLLMSGGLLSVCGKTTVYASGSERIQIEDLGAYPGYSQGKIRMQITVSGIDAGIRSVRIRGNGKVLADEKTEENGELQTTWGKLLELSQGEGACYLEVEVTDREGKRFFENREWVVDQTNPVLRVDFPQKGEAQYTNVSGAVQMEVQESHFLREGSTIVWKEHPAGGQTAEWKQIAEDMYRCEILYEKEGWYEMQVQITDAAGNRTESERYRWLVDRSVPKIRSEGVTDGAHYRGEVQLEINVEDDHIHPDDIAYLLTGEKHGEIPLKLEKESKKLIWKPESGEAGDDRYTLKVSAEDLAGNRAQQEITFVVNRTGAVYTVSGIENGMNEEKVEDPQIEITDQSRLVEWEILYGWESEVRLLKEEDYRMTEEQTDEGWKYVCSLSDTLFEREGIYTVTVTTKDEAGNENSTIKNSRGSQPLHFQIKKEQPQKAVVKKRTGTQEKNRAKEHQADGWIAAAGAGCIGVAVTIRKIKGRRQKNKKRTCNRKNVML